MARWSYSVDRRLSSGNLNRLPVRAEQIDLIRCGNDARMRRCHPDRSPCRWRRKRWPMQIGSRTDPALLTAALCRPQIGKAALDIDRLAASARVVRSFEDRVVEGLPTSRAILSAGGDPAQECARTPRALRTRLGPAACFSGWHQMAAAGGGKQR